MDVWADGPLIWPKEKFRNEHFWDFNTSTMREIEQRISSVLKTDTICCSCKKGIKISLKDTLALLPPSLYMPKVTDMQLSSAARVTKEEILYRVRLIFSLSVAALTVWGALNSMDLTPFIAAESTQSWLAGWLADWDSVSQASLVHRTTHAHPQTHFFISLLQIPALRELCVCVCCKLPECRHSWAKWRKLKRL